MTVGLDFQLRALVGDFNRDIQGASAVVTREAGRMNAAAQSVDKTLRTAATGGIGRFGTQIQQAGFQIGDFAVQVASGQRPLTAFIQQGSQLAGAFGPWGAVLGAAGAVVGALATALLGAGTAAGDLEETTDALGDAIGALRGAAVNGVDGLNALVERYGALDAQLVGLIQRQTQFNLLLAQSSLRDTLGSAVGDARDFDRRLLSDPDGTDSEGRRRRSTAGGLAEELGVTRERAEELQRAVIDLSRATTLDQQVDAATALGDALAGAVTPESSRELIDFAGKLNDVVLQVREYEEAARQAAESSELLARPLPELRGLLDEGGGGGGGSAGRATLDDDAFGKAAQAASDRIFQLERERELVGLTAAEQARLNTEYEAGRLRLDLLNKARETGNGISAQELAIIDVLVADYKTAADALIAAKDAQDALSESQRAAAQAAEESKRALEQVGNAIAGAITQADSFEDALRNVAVQLANLAIQGVGGAGPFGGALGGLIPSLFGGGGTTTGTPLTVATARLPQLARGTSYFPGGAAIVGEEGPELVRLPRGSQVIPARQTAAMMSGGATINVDARGATDPAAVEAAARRGAAIALAQVPSVNRDMRRRGAL